MITNASYFMKMEKLLPNTDSFETNNMVPVLDKVIKFSLFTFVAFSMFSISVTQISFAIGAIASLLKIHLTKSWKKLRGIYIGIPILCFCLACVLSIIVSVDFGSSLNLLKKLIQFIIFFWVANEVQDEKQRELLFKLVILAGVAASVNGILPLITSSFFSMNGLYGGIRIIGTMSTPSTFSGTIMITGLAALGRLLFHKPKEYWVLGSVGIITLCLLISLTRQAWLGFAIGTVFLLFFWNKKYLLIIPVLLAGILLFSSDRIVERIHSFTDLKDSSFQARIFLWEGGWKIFKDHPITGCGFKCVDSIHSQYSDPSGWVSHYRGMHSNILQLLVDTGIVGLGTWFSIWIAYITRALKCFKTLVAEKSQSNVTGILMGTSAAVLAFIVGGFFESNLYDSEVSMLIYFLMGLSLTHVRKSPSVE
jgi:O-antigen ligase